MQTTSLLAEKIIEIPASMIRNGHHKRGRSVSGFGQSFSGLNRASGQARQVCDVVNNIQKEVSAAFEEQECVSRV